MSIKFDDSGYRKLKQAFGEMESAQIPITEIFTLKFMSENTKFSSITDLLTASGININAAGNIADSDESKLNEFVSANTKFRNWSEMYQSAFKEYLKGKF